jgi:hypothetical protein
MSRVRHDSRRGVRWGFTLSGLALVLALGGGCGGKNRLDVAPVHGRVVYNGQGVPRAVVIFHPSEDADERAKKMRPFAYADDSGNFQLKTYVDDDGAPPGTYRVSIIARSSGGSRPSKDEGPSDQLSAPGAAIRIPPQITQKYANVDTSDIEVTVEEGENNLEPFVLK